VKRFLAVTLALSCLVGSTATWAAGRDLGTWRCYDCDNFDTWIPPAGSGAIGAADQLVVFIKSVFNAIQSKAVRI
jgi:hypothetical protein